MVRNIRINFGQWCPLEGANTINIWLVGDVNPGKNQFKGAL